MADPTPYERAYSFTDYQASDPSAPLPGVQVDNELENIEQSLSEAIDAIKDVRRSDGALKNGIVTVDSLSPAVLAGVGAGALASAEAAAASADAASDSAVAAAASATAASGSATTASGYASDALTSRNEAETERTLAQSARTGAQTARDFANQWATEAENTLVDDGVNTPGYSAYHWAQAAEAAAAAPIPDGSVTTIKIANAAVTLEKLAPEVTDAIAAAAVVDDKFISVAVAAAATIDAATRRIGTQFHSPNFAVPKTLIGGASYRRISLADLGGYPSASYFRSVDRYMPDGSTNSTNGGYWVLDEIRPHPAQFGAPCNLVGDDAPAIEALGNYLIARSGGGVMYFPKVNDGYLVKTAVDITMPVYNASTAYDLDAIDLVGDGRGVSKIYIDASFTSDFAITVTRQYNRQSCHARGLTFIPLATTVGTPNRGALYFASTWTTASGGWGVQNRHQCTIWDCEVTNEKVDGTDGYIRTGFRIDWAYHPKVFGCTVHTHTQWGRSDNQFAEGYGIEFYNCYLSESLQNWINGRFRRSIYCWGDQATGEFEGLKVFLNTLDGEPEYCIELDHANQVYRETWPKEPGCDILNNHLDGSKGSLIIRHHEDIRVMGNKLYLTQLEYDYDYGVSRGITLEACLDAQIAGNQYFQNGVNNGVTHVAYGANRATRPAGTGGSVNTSVNSQDSILAVVFTTPAAAPSATPGQVIFESGTNLTGLSLVYQNDRRLAFFAGTGAASPLLVTTDALAVSTQYTVIVEIDQTFDEIRLHYKKVGTKTFFYRDRKPEAKLTGFTQTTVCDAGGCGVGTINTTLGGFSGTVSGTTDFAGTIDANFEVWDLGDGTSECILLDKDCRNIRIRDEIFGSVGIGVNSYADKTETIFVGPCEWTEAYGSNKNSVRGPNYRYLESSGLVGSATSTKLHLSEPYRVILSRVSAAQVIPGGALTAIIFDTSNLEEVDVWDASPTPTRVTIPDNFGIKLAKFKIRVQFASNATGVRRVSLQKNGGAAAFGFYNTVPADTGSDTFITAEGLWIGAVAGDYFQVTVYQNSGGDLNLTSAYLEVEMR